MKIKDLLKEKNVDFVYPLTISKLLLNEEYIAQLIITKLTKVENKGYTKDSYSGKKQFFYQEIENNKEFLFIDNYPMDTEYTSADDRDICYSPYIFKKYIVFECKESDVVAVLTYDNLEEQNYMDDIFIRDLKVYLFEGLPLQRIDINTNNVRSNLSSEIPYPSIDYCKFKEFETLTARINKNKNDILKIEKNRISSEYRWKILTKGNE